MDRQKSIKLPVCSLCSQAFALRTSHRPGFGPRSPLILKCGHSACEGCILKALADDNRITCSCEEISFPSEEFSEDKVQHEFPFDYYTIGVCTVSTNISLTDVKIGFQKQAYQRHQTKKRITVCCHECRKVDADCNCVQCDVPYCSPCFKTIHQFARAFREHEMVPLWTSADELGRRDILCPIHKLQVEFFCNECTVSICSRCLINDHKGHDIDLLSDKNTTAMEELVDLHIKVVNLQTRLKSTRKKVVQTLSRGIVNSKIFELEKSIGEHFAWLHGRLTSQHYQLISEIHSSNRESQREIKQILGRLDEYNADIDRVLAVSNQLVKTSQKFNVSVNYMAVISALKEKAELPCFFVSEMCQANFRFVSDPTICESLEDNCSLEKLEEGISSHQLVRECELPDGYEINPITEVTKDNFTGQVDEPQRPRSSSNASISSQGSDAQNSQLHEFTEGGICPATLCHVTSPSDFYVHRPGVVRLLANFHSQFSKLGSCKKHPPIDTIKGRLYLVKFGHDNKWYRGRVMNIEDLNKIDIFYIDYGNSETVSNDRLRIIPTNLANIEPLATHCRMYNCVPATGSTWSPEAISLMAQLPKNGDISIRVKKVHKDIIDVDILQHINNAVMSFQESLLFLGLAVLTDSCDVVLNQYKRIKSFPPQVSWHIGDTFQARVTYIESLSNFYVFNMQASQKIYLKMKEDLNIFYRAHFGKKNMQVHHPQLGMPVAVQSGYDWYRALITEVFAKKIVKVFLVDSGNEEALPWNKMMVLIPKFLRCSPLVQKCRLSGIPPISGDALCSNAVKMFKATSSGINLKLVVDAVGTDTVDVTLYTNRTGKNQCVNSVLEQLAKDTDPNGASHQEPLHDEITGASHQAPVHESTGASHNEPLHESTGANSDEQEDVLTTMFENAQSFFKYPVEFFGAEFSKFDGVNPHLVVENDILRLKVIIKRIVSPGEFYVTPTWMIEKLTGVKNRMTEFYQKATKDIEEHIWNVNDVCAVNVVIGNFAWHRATILEKVDASSVKVNLLDEGQEDVVTLDKVFPLGKQFKNLIEGVFKCRLGGIQSPSHPGVWPHFSTSEMKSLTANNSDQLFISQMGNIKDRFMPVELFIRKVIPAGPLEAIRFDWNSINNRLRMAGLATTDGTKQWSVDEYLSESCEPLNYLDTLEESDIDNPNEDFEPKVVNELTKSLPTEWIPPEPFQNLEFLAKPTYVDHSATIYVQDFQRSVLKLETISKELNKAYDGSVSSANDKFWTVGEICIARYHLDGKWYRGVVEEVQRERIVVKFVDYGNVEECDLADMRKMPLMVDIPIQCQPCYLFNIVPATPDEKWTSPLLDYLHTLVVEKRCQINLCILSKEDGDSYGINSLRMPTGKDLIVYMVEEGYARYNSKIFTDFNLLSSESCNGEEQEEAGETEKPINDGDTTEEVVIESDVTYVCPEKSTRVQFDSPNETFEDENKANKLYWVDLISQNSDVSTLNYKHMVIPDDVTNLEVDITALLSVKQVLVTIADSSNEVLNEVIKKFQDLLTAMQEEAPNQPKLKPPYLYQACCVKFTEDNKWYRAVVLQEMPDDKLLIQYVDYGNVEVVLSDQVHQLKEEWTSVEVQATLVTLDNVRLCKRENHHEAAEMLSECLVSNSVTARIKGQTDYCLMAELFIGDKLAYQDLIDKKCIELTS